MKQFLASLAVISFVRAVGVFEDHPRSGHWFINPLEQAELTVDRNGQAEVTVGPLRRRPAPGGPPKEAALNQERFVNLLEGSPVLTHRGGEGVETYRSSGELLDEAAEDGAVAGFEADGVDLELIERTPSTFEADHLLAGDIGEVADAAQQPFRHPHGPARPAADLEGGTGFEVETEDLRESRVTPSANSSSV